METYIASDKTMDKNNLSGFEVKAATREEAMVMAQAVGQQHGWKPENVFLLRCCINPALKDEKERFRILVEMVNELLPADNALSFMETINSHLVTTLGELTRKPEETEDTRYSRIDDEVEKRLKHRRS